MLKLLVFILAASTLNARILNENEMKGIFDRNISPTVKRENRTKEIHDFYTLADYLSERIKQKDRQANDYADTLVEMYRDGHGWWGGFDYTQTANKNTQDFAVESLRTLGVIAAPTAFSSPTDARLNGHYAVINAFIGLANSYFPSSKVLKTDDDSAFSAIRSNRNWPIYAKIANPTGEDDYTLSAMDYSAWDHIHSLIPGDLRHTVNPRPYVAPASSSFYRGSFQGGVDGSSGFGGGGGGAAGGVTSRTTSYAQQPQSTYTRLFASLGDEDIRRARKFLNLMTEIEPDSWGPLHYNMVHLANDRIGNLYQFAQENGLNLDFPYDFYIEGTGTGYDGKTQSKYGILINAAKRNFKARFGINYDEAQAAVRDLSAATSRPGVGSVYGGGSYGSSGFGGSGSAPVGVTALPVSYGPPPPPPSDDPWGSSSHRPSPAQAIPAGAVPVAIEIRDKIELIKLNLQQIATFGLGSSEQISVETSGLIGELYKILRDNGLYSEDLGKTELKRGLDVYCLMLGGRPLTEMGFNSFIEAKIQTNFFRKYQMHFDTVFKAAAAPQPGSSGYGGYGSPGVDNTRVAPPASYAPPPPPRAPTVEQRIDYSLVATKLNSRAEFDGYLAGAERILAQARAAEAKLQAEEEAKQRQIENCIVKLGGREGIVVVRNFFGLIQGLGKAEDLKAFYEFAKTNGLNGDFPVLPMESQALDSRVVSESERIIDWFYRNLFPKAKRNFREKFKIEYYDAKDALDELDKLTGAEAKPAYSPWDAPSAKARPSFEEERAAEAKVGASLARIAKQLGNFDAALKGLYQEAIKTPGGKTIKVRMGTDNQIQIWSGTDSDQPSGTIMLKVMSNSGQSLYRVNSGRLELSSGTNNPTWTANIARTFGLTS
jgi:hypothetical protein